MSDQAATSALEEEVEAALALMHETADMPPPPPRMPRAFQPSEAASGPQPQPAPPAAPAAPAEQAEPPRQPLAAVRPMPLRERASSMLSRGLDDDVSRFLATAERMLVRIRNEIADAESAYVVDRAKLADGYRRRIGELEIEAADALGRMESSHRDDMSKRKRMLDALMAMRGE